MTISIGDRLLIAKHKATVRYVGAVDGYEGTWVGVEWDDPSRGKHDGSTGGKKYFQCQSPSPTAGSFVRINRVSEGGSLVDALILRYTNQLAEGQASADGQVFLHTGGNRKVWVELVGEDKVTEHQSKTHLLLSARLVGANIGHMGPAGALSRTAPNLTSLDLTDNLISSWATIAAICQELPQLRALVLSGNRLHLPSSAGQAAAGGLQLLPGLQCLVLNQCGITWQQVGVLLSSLPNLLELHLGGNNITSLHLDLQQAPQQQLQQEQQQQQQPKQLQQPQQEQQQQQQCPCFAGLGGFLSLQALGLEDNQLSDWCEVLRLAGLPNLKRLHLSGNPISSITYPAHPVPPTALLDDHHPAAEPSKLHTHQQQHQQNQQAVLSTGQQQTEAQQQQQQGPQQPFGVLEALLLGNCQLGSWADVDQLNCFPALRELRLSGNPLTTAHGAAAGAGRRFEVIGRVAGLTLLNGADVKPRERRDCELRYLQNIAAETAEAAAQQQQMREQQQVQHVHHPRLAELQAKYGQVSAVAKPSQQGSSLSSTTCELLLVHGGSTTRKKLPKTVTVAALKLLCGRLFKLPPDQQQLLLHMPGSDASDAQQQQQQAEDISQDETKTLGYWDVVDGCVVRVVHVDPQQLRLQQEAAQLSKQQEHEQRMAQQLQQGEVLRTAAER